MLVFFSFFFSVATEAIFFQLKAEMKIECFFNAFFSFVCGCGAGRGMKGNGSDVRGVVRWV